jgi:hypothetical protein
MVCGKGCGSEPSTFATATAPVPSTKVISFPSGEMSTSDAPGTIPVPVVAPVAMSRNASSDGLGATTPLGPFEAGATP